MASPVAPESFPLPDADARSRSEALSERIRAEIDRAPSGAIGFARFMELALYAPGLGYYSGGAANFGPAGDFTTGPEISSLFGRCVARQIREVLAALGGGQVLELGGGTGALAEAALDEFARLGAETPRWLILEPSPELRDRQRARLGARVAWIDTLPTGFRGVIFANEVADALPVERFCIRDDRVLALGVTWDRDSFAWVEQPAPAELDVRVRRVLGAGMDALPDGYRSEVCLSLGAWIASLSETLGAGLLLLSDYGLPRAEYYAPERADGTLLCHYRHRAHRNPFLWPGLQDITAWVDFTTIAEAGTASGLTLEGFTPQAAFLAANGLAEMVADAADDACRARLANESKQLVLPGEMGERFRFMGLSRGLEPALGGFALVDLAGRL